VLFLMKKIIVGKIALILLDILMVLLFVLFTGIELVLLWGKIRYVKREYKLSIIIPVALTIVDMIYTPLIKKIKYIQ